MKQCRQIPVSQYSGQQVPVVPLLLSAIRETGSRGTEKHPSGQRRQLSRSVGRTAEKITAWLQCNSLDSLQAAVAGKCLRLNRRKRDLFPVSGYTAVRSRVALLLHV
ncbi:unnamed protein product [Arctogadus glacialis]